MVNNLLHTKTKVFINNMDSYINNTSIYTNKTILTKIQIIRILKYTILNMVYIRNISNNRNIFIKLKKDYNEVPKIGFIS